MSLGYKALSREPLNLLLEYIIYVVQYVCVCVPLRNMRENSRSEFSKSLFFLSFILGFHPLRHHFTSWVAVIIDDHRDDLGRETSIVLITEPLKSLESSQSASANHAEPIMSRSDDSPIDVNVPLEPLVSTLKQL